MANDIEASIKLAHDQIQRAFAKAPSEPYAIRDGEDRTQLSFAPHAEGITIHSFINPDDMPPEMTWQDAADFGAWLLARAAEHGVVPAAPATGSDPSRDVRGIYVECHQGRDIVASLYDAWNKLPCCSLLSVIGGAIQEIQALRGGAASGTAARRAETGTGSAAGNGPTP